MRGHLHVPGFTVGRRLGEASSTNWLAVHDASGTPVTLRVVSGPALSARSRLVAAIDVLRELDHPHVLRYQDMIERDDDIVFVLEAADGGSLSDLLRARGTLPPGELVTACAPIAEGLAEMHQHAIVHGAVTADDIVFAADGRPMLAGVGLGVLGVWPPQDAPSIAPETVVGAAAEPPADVYSLAYAACVALSGYQPRQPLSIVGIPGTTLGVLSRCLQRTPDHRPDVSVLANAIYGVAAPEPVDLVPEEVEATSSMPRISAAPPEPGVDTGTIPEVGSEEDVESFMRGRAGGRRARRPRREEPAAGHDEAAAPQDPDSTATKPIDTGAHVGLAGQVAGADSAAPETPPVEEPAPVGASAFGSGGGGRRRGAERSGDAGGGGTPSGRARTPADPGGRRGGGSVDFAKVAIGIVIVLLLGAGVIFGRQLFGGDDDLPSAENAGADETVEPTDLCGGPQPAPTEAPPAVTDWAQEVQRLFDLRTQAFSELDATLLCEVYAPASTSLARDVSTLQQYSDAEVQPEGLAFEVIDVALVAENGGTVTVEITDQITEYTLVDSDGEVQKTQPAVPADTYQIDLVAVAGADGGPPTWRLSS